MTCSHPHREFTETGWRCYDCLDVSQDVPRPEYSDDRDNEHWYNHYDGEDCDHEDYTITWEGRCECGRCSQSWWATSAQMEAQARLEVEYAEWEASQHEGRTVWWRRTVVGLLAYVLVVYGPWKLTCNTKTGFGNWCVSNSGDWVYRAKRPI